MTDTELIIAMQNGWAGALGELYDRHAAAVYGVCLQFAKDKTDADGALLMAFQRLWLTRVQLSGTSGNLRRMLCAIAAQSALALSNKAEAPVDVSLKEVEGKV